MAGARVASIREQLQAQGLSSQAIENIFKSWSEATNKSYEARWARWTQHQEAARDSAFDPQLNSVVEFISDLMTDNATEDEIKGYLSVINVPIKLISNNDVRSNEQVQCLLRGLKNTAPSQAAYSKTWDITNVFVHVDKMPDPSACTDIQVRDTVDLLMAAEFAWRHIDRIGIFVELGIELCTDGVLVRFFNGKTTQAKWSNFVKATPFLLYPKANLIVWLNEWCGRLTRLGPIKRVMVRAPKETLVTPLFINSNRKKDGSGLRCILRVTSLSSAIRKLFEGWKHDDKPFLDTFKQYTVKHASVSAMLDAGVPKDILARRSQVDEKNLFKSYIREVVREYPLHNDESKVSSTPAYAIRSGFRSYLATEYSEEELEEVRFQSDEKFMEYYSDNIKHLIKSLVKDK